MKKIIIYTNIVLFPVLLLQIQVFAQCVQCSGGTASGNAASIIGLNNTASGSYSFAGGVNSLASGGVSFAFGTAARAEAPYAVALGGETKASYANSFAIGTFCSAEASNSFIIGTGASDLLKIANTVPYSLVMGFGSTKPTLFIGPSPGTNLTGKVGIGDITNPQAKLHIKSDDGEAAEVFIEPNPTSTTASLWLGTKQYGVRKTASRLDFKTAPGGVYVFNDGNVGIGTISPTQKLQVNGNIMTSGFIMTGGAGAGKVLTSDASGNANWTDPVWVIENDNIHRLNGNVGIGTANPSQKLEVNGNLRTTGFIMPTGAANGRVLTSNASGTATWTNPQWTTSGSNIYRTTGNVGIGTSVTGARLAVSNSASANSKTAEFIDSENRKLFFVPKLSSSGYNPISSANDAGIFWSDGSASGGQNLNAGFVIAPHKDGAVTGISIDHQGNVGIGKKPSPLARLDVNGTVKASTIEAPIMNINTMTISTLTVTSKLWAAEIEVTNLAGWKDYVFEDDYPLMPLSQVEAFIMENRHLPGIPSEKEVMASGFNVAEMNAMLLQKIEELTLYVIELEKKIELFDRK